MSSQPFAEPKIETLGALRLAGVRYAGKNEHGEVPQLWDAQFLPRVGELVVDTQHWVAYGVARECQGLPPDQGFEYLAAAEVNTFDHLPAGMVGWEIPALTYAVVPAEDVPGIAPASDFFYTRWLPHSQEYEMDAPLMIEIYKEDFSVTHTIYLYFPVRPKKGA